MATSLRGRDFTAASVPGKVLVCGGYLVVDRPNPGLSIALDARFHCIGTWLTGPAAATEGNAVCFKVCVKSPQLACGEETSEFRLVCPEPHVAIRIEDGPTRNAFVRSAVAFSLLHLLSCERRRRKVAQSGGISLALLGDNAYYSQTRYLQSKGLAVTNENLAALPRFNKIVPQSGKTGIGSSAGVVTSIVGCLFALFGLGEATGEIHAVAQVAHCGAQGKVGSGFDVATAVAGTNEYTRYSPGIVKEALEKCSLAGPAAALLPFTGLSGIFPAEAWDHRVAACALPPGFCLSLADVNKGSETPSMVSAVFKWKAAGGKRAEELWAAAAEANRRIISALRALCSFAGAHGDVFETARRAFESVPCHAWGANSQAAGPAAAEAAALLVAARDAFSEARKCLRAIGREASVPVEPAQQTELLDRTIRGVPGTLAVGCPGAGGFDAVFAVSVSPDAASRLPLFWSAYSAPDHDIAAGDVCALAVQQDKAAGLDVRSFPSHEALAAVYPPLTDWD
eukprot:gene18341-28267_t